MCQELIQGGGMGEFVNVALNKNMYKDGKRYLIRGCHPITFFNIYYNILAKSLANGIWLLVA